MECYCAVCHPGRSHMDRPVDLKIQPAIHMRWVARLAKDVAIAHYSHSAQELPAGLNDEDAAFNYQGLAAYASLDKQPFLGHVLAFENRTRRYAIGDVLLDGVDHDLLGEKHFRAFLIELVGCAVCRNGA